MNTTATGHNNSGHAPHCSRNMQCANPATCRQHAVLTDMEVAARMRNQHLQFWGDSVSALMECDLRERVLRAVGASNARIGRTSGYFPTLNASSSYIRVGCPWTCSVGKLRAAPDKTHIIFNIGSHYEADGVYRGFDGQHFANSLRQFEPTLRRTNARVVIRSQTKTHFPTPFGYFNRTLSANEWRTHPPPACMARPPADGLHFTEVEIRRFATRLDADYLDVLGLSDDPNAHPQYHDGKPVFDCRHPCQNCDTLGTWNSALLSLF
eukprot:CAMPEP_0119403160 /NCGR_PEP_ID=MMETSP1334-20130426/143244_1 /TAXON_ID=127549 /ORGANISM="Calcidiscus leptoporus, Strain RCC1130" /LENGTH=265 /DNA_ID=CAMNT_0007427101 /DNA_START=153 /DNA_END=950 /DNA_ORIENTATION=+